MQIENEIEQVNKLRRGADSSPDVEETAEQNVFISKPLTKEELEK